MFDYPEAFSPSSQLLGVAPTTGTWFIFAGRKLLVFAEAALPRATSLEALGIAPLRSHFLGTLDGEPCFSAEVAAASEVPGGNFVDLRALLGLMSEPLLGVASRASQVVEWDRNHQFCGACGHRTLPHPHGNARRCGDPACGLLHFPRISPAMIVLVERGDEVLLARSPHFPEGVYSTLAGFVEPGESLEQTVHREVWEEVGVRVRNLRYFGSQSWPFPHSLMLGFFAEYAGGELRLAPDEIEDAGFFPIGRLPKLFPGRTSVGNQLIAAHCEARGAAFP
jgi:NAD+ diphosphatase